MKSGIELSSRAQSLLRAAKSDAPGAVARAKIWSGVSAGMGAGAGGATTTATGAVATSKLVMTSALFGGAITIGLALTALYLHSSSAGADTIVAPVPVAAGATQAATVDVATPEVILDPAPPAPRVTEAKLAGATPTQPLPPPGRFVAPRVPGTQAALPRRTGGATPAKLTTGDLGRGDAVGGGGSAMVHESEQDDMLMREASLVAEARGALVRGDAKGALAKVRAAKSLPSTQLGPEELALEAQALRALGNAAEATGTEARLKNDFPDNGLGH